MTQLVIDLGPCAQGYVTARRHGTLRRWWDSGEEADDMIWLMFKLCSPENDSWIRDDWRARLRAMLQPVFAVSLKYCLDSEANDIALPVAYDSYMRFVYAQYDKLKVAYGFAALNEVVTHNRSWRLARHEIDVHIGEIADELIDIVRSDEHEGIVMREELLEIPPNEIFGVIDNDVTAKMIQDRLSIDVLAKMLEVDPDEDLKATPWRRPANGK